MGAIPGTIETDQSPPLTVPLRHFVVGLVLLLAAAAVGVGEPLGVLAGRPDLAYPHLLLAGWVCVTIMGAMTQFVPVWSGVSLHSRRLSTVQLWLVVVGLAALVAAFLTSAYAWLPVGGALVLAGFWTFVYNVGRTLARARPWDVTERHFALALGFFVLVTALGLSLAIGFTRPLFAGTGVDQASIRMAHGTLALYGVVLTTVFGALYQLATMFTQSELYGVDHHLQRIEASGYPVGVLALAAGRLFGVAPLGRLGAVLVVASVCCVSAILWRRLSEAQVEWTPMLSRYTVVAAAMAAWALWTAPAWIRDPLAAETLYGAPDAAALLTIGVIGFVVLGTLYHIVPFIVWVHRYSDLLGLEDVPMIDDLYDDRLAALDFALFAAGLAALLAADLLAVPEWVAVAGGTLVAAGAVVFLANQLLVIRRHSPHALPGILFERFAGAGDDDRSRNGAEPRHDAGSRSDVEQLPHQ